MIGIGINIGNIVAVAGYEPSAAAFISAAGITNTTQQIAINDLVVSLKSYNLWTKIKACYPWVGGSAFSHKFNLVNPLDSNAAFRLTFFGGWTHNENGGTAGINGYADTFFNPVIQSTLNTNLTLSMYHIGSLLSGGFLPYFGNGQTSSPANYTCLLYTNKEAGGIASLANWSPSSSNPAYNGLKTITCNGSRTAIFYKNADVVLGSNTMSGSFQNSTFYISALNNGSGVYNAGVPATNAFTVIADGFSATDVSNFYTIVQAFQTTLGRQV